MIIAIVIIIVIVVDVVVLATSSLRHSRRQVFEHALLPWLLKSSPQVMRRLSRWSRKFHASGAGLGLRVANKSKVRSMGPLKVYIGYMVGI